MDFFFFICPTFGPQSKQSGRDCWTFLKNPHPSPWEHAGVGQVTPSQEKREIRALTKAGLTPFI